MSEIQVGQINSTDGSTAITTGADGYVSFAKTQIGGRRNLIINGAMQVAQRGTSETGITGSGYFTVDRIRSGMGDTSAVFTMEQSTDAPDGFSNSAKYTCTTADTAFTTTERLFFSQRIEGQNLQHLKKGTSNAESVTMSFWVKSNKTGDYTLEIYDRDNNRHISKSYTINASATWEYKTVTFAGDTAGALNNDNGDSLEINWWLFAGTSYTSGTQATSWASDVAANRAASTQANLADATSNYWQITGVQLEVGPLATPFEHRSYGEELALCQRYYWKAGLKAISAVASGKANNTTDANFYIPYPVPMRSAPTSTFSGMVIDFATSTASYSSVNLFASSTACLYNATGASGLTSGHGLLLRCGSDTGFIDFSSEL